MFPEVYKNLKALAIQSYAVYLDTGEMIWTHTDCTLRNQAPLKKFDFGPFDTDKIIKSLQKHQRGETSYGEWLEEVTRAGVHLYIVTMSNDKVVYLDQKTTRAYVEEIPKI